MEKKTKVKRAKAEKISIKDRLGGLFFTVIALIVAAVVFSAFMFLQSYFAEKIIYKNIFVVKQEIPAGEIIKEDNISTYFESKQINSLNAVEGAIQPSEQKKLYGMKSKVVLRVGEEVSLTDFVDTNIYLDNIKNPVEMSIETSGIGFTNGGKIRAGDIVNITLMFSSTQLGLDKYPAPTIGEGTDDKTHMGTLTPLEKDESGYNFEFYARYMLENIYVEKVLTSDGVEISPTDESTAAGIIVLVIPKDIELKLNNILSNCQNMRISKVLYEITPEDLYKDPSLKDDIVKLDDLEEGWVVKDNVGYKPTIKEGISHYKKEASGNIVEEDCVLNKDSHICELCGGEFVENKKEDVEPETLEKETEKSTSATNGPNENESESKTEKKEN